MSALIGSSMALDPTALGGLKLAAQREDPEAVRESAQQFEALMIQRVMKEMRASAGDDGVFGSSQMDTYYDMFDKQVAVDMAEKGGLGLADMLVRQLETAARNPGIKENPVSAANASEEPINAAE